MDADRAELLALAKRRLQQGVGRVNDPERWRAAAGVRVFHETVASTKERFDSRIKRLTDGCPGKAARNVGAAIKSTREALRDLENLRERVDQGVADSEALDGDALGEVVRVFNKAASRKRRDKLSKLKHAGKRARW